MTPCGHRPLRNPCKTPLRQRPPACLYYRDTKEHSTDVVDSCDCSVYPLGTGIRHCLHRVRPDSYPARARDHRGPDPRHSGKAGRLMITKTCLSRLLVTAAAAVTATA